MFVRRLLMMGVVCGSLLLGTAHVADAKTIFGTLDDVATTPHDTPVDIDVTANDHGQAISIAIATGPHHGTATIKGLIVHYVPDPGYVGLDALFYSASGCVGGEDCNETTSRVDITVTGPAPTTTTTGPATTTTEPATTTTEPAATTTVAVAGSTVPATAAADLPRTGSTSGGLAALAGGLIVAGAGALAVSRRRNLGTRR